LRAIRPGPRAAVLLLALAASSTMLGGCARFGPPCTVSLAAIPSGAGAADGAQLPSSAVILASPADFQPSKASFGQDMNGLAVVNLQLEPEAAARLASYTGSHVGEPLAVAIDRTIFAVAVIRGEIPDGAVTITPNTPEEAERLPTVFLGCVTHASQPPPASPTSTG
jgi:hypothetical protein